jgi:hypothetical protein
MQCTNAVNSNSTEGRTKKQLVQNLTLNNVGMTAWDDYVYTQNKVKASRMVEVTAESDNNLQCRCQIDFLLIRITPNLLFYRSKAALLWHIDFMSHVIYFMHVLIPQGWLRYKMPLGVLGTNGWGNMSTSKTKHN